MTQATAPRMPPARKLIGTAGFTEGDEEDIIQDLILHLWEHPFVHDESRASFVGIVCCILDRKIANIIESRCAAKRNHGKRDVSLDEEPESPNGERRPRNEIYSVDAYMRLTGRATRSQEELGDLGLDAARALQSLPPHLRRIADLLRHHSKSDVARMLGIPWSTFCDRLKRIRALLEEENLQEYL